MDPRSARYRAAVRAITDILRWEDPASLFAPADEYSMEAAELARFVMRRSPSERDVQSVWRQYFGEDMDAGTLRSVTEKLGQLHEELVADSGEAVPTLQDFRADVTEPSGEALSRELAAALRDIAFVELHRRIPGADVVDGYVVGLNDRWVVVHRAAADVLLNGYAAVRIDDLVRATPAANGGFVPRALEAMGERPAVPPTLDLTDDPAMARWMATEFGLVTVHVEDEDPEVCYIGRLVAATDKALRLRELDPSAAWRRRVSVYRFEDVTRLEAGGRYERALLKLAEADPTS